MYFIEGPALKRKPTPPKGFGRRASEEEKGDTDTDEQELVTVTKVVEEASILSVSLDRSGVGRVRNCAFLVTNATKNLVLATSISQLVTRICHLATENFCLVASWHLHKKS